MKRKNFQNLLVGFVILVQLVRLSSQQQDYFPAFRLKPTGLRGFILYSLEKLLARH